MNEEEWDHEEFFHYLRKEEEIENGKQRMFLVPEWRLRAAIGAGYLHGINTAGPENAKDLFDKLLNVKDNSVDMLEDCCQTDE